MEVFSFGQVLMFNPVLDGLLCGKLRANKTNVPLNEWTSRAGVARVAGGYRKTSKQYADLYCAAYLPLEKLELERSWRSAELRVSGMAFPRGSFAKLVAKA